MALSHGLPVPGPQDVITTPRFTNEKTEAPGSQSWDCHMDKAALCRYRRRTVTPNDDEPGVVTTRRDKSTFPRPSRPQARTREHRGVTGRRPWFRC